MPETNFRALCAELVESLENARRIIQGADGTLHINTAEFVLRRARAALAQPEPVAPKPVVDYSRVPEIATEAQIRSAAQYLVKKRNCDGDLIPAIEYAIARWGNSQGILDSSPQLEPVAPTDDELDGLYFKPVAGPMVPYRRYARSVLDRWGRPAPQPVSVRERLPGPEDCDAEGMCWGWWTDPTSEYWEYVGVSAPIEPYGSYIPRSGHTHWLPANAIPTPEVTNDQ
jgi:hypothetical protein